MNSTDLARFIAAHQIDAEIIMLPVETPTVAAAAAAVGVEPAQIIKSVLFLANAAPVLVIANGLGRIAWKFLADFLGVSRRRLKTANSAQVLAVTGYPAGAVPPFGHLTALKTYVDTAVFKQTLIYGGGGERNALIRLTTQELRRVLNPVSANFIESIPGEE